MFIITNIATKSEDLSFQQTVICPFCGRYSSVRAYKTYRYFSLYFIPLARWGHTYYMETKCCNSVYEIPKEIGKAIEKDPNVVLNPDDLGVSTVTYPVSEDISPLSYEDNESIDKVFDGKKCQSCGYELNDNFTYCPQCGRRL